MKHQAFNPYLPSYEYVPDGEPRVFGDRLYIFGSHDAFEGDGYCPNDYVCWSAPVDDPGDWRYEGVIFPRDGDPMNADGHMKLFAPDVVQGVDGRYYLYFVYNASGLVSVAVCDTPAGRYQFLGYVRKPDGTPYGATAGDVNCFDPGVLVDEGRVWLYVGFAPGPGELRDNILRFGKRMEGGYCMELEPDMLTVKGEATLTVPGLEGSQGTDYEGHGFFEASSIRRVGDRYYFVYSSQLSHELCYAVSDRPDRDFRYGGTLVSIGDLGLNGNREALNYTGNTHGGMIQLGEQWYIFYHRQTNKQGCARQGCAEPITIRPDGSIPQAELTSCGLNGGPLKGTGTYEARIACHLGYKEPAFAYVATHEYNETHPYFTQSGADREDNPDQYIANMADGAWCGFKYFAFDGESKIAVTARGSAEGKLLVSTGKGETPFAAVPTTPAADWAEFSASFPPLTGTKALYFTYQGAGAMDFREFRLSD